jgi:hypothetical protein
MEKFIFFAKTTLFFGFFFKKNQSLVGAIDSRATLESGIVTMLPLCECELILNNFSISFFVFCRKIISLFQVCKIGSNLKCVCFTVPKISYIYIWRNY